MAIATNSPVEVITRLGVLPDHIQHPLLVPRNVRISSFDCATHLLSD
jgi:hypothetical protein